MDFLGFINYSIRIIIFVSCSFLYDLIPTLESIHYFIKYPDFFEHQLSEFLDISIFVLGPLSDASCAKIRIKKRVLQKLTFSV